MSNTWAIVSLLGLIVVVILANWKNINVGLVGFAMAMLLSTIAGLKLKDVYGSFNTQIFLRMLGMQVLIVIARTNGTMKILANAVMKVTRGKAIRLLPIVLYIAMGMGGWFNLGINAALTPLLYVIGVEMGFSNHLTLGFCGMFNLFSWGISPYSMGGLNLAAYAAEQGYTLNLWAGASAVRSSLCWLRIWALSPAMSSRLWRGRISLCWRLTTIPICCRMAPIPGLSSGESCPTAGILPMLMLPGPWPD